VEHVKTNHKFIVKENVVTCHKRGCGMFLVQLSQRIWAMQTRWLIVSWLDVSDKYIDELKKGKVPPLLKSKAAMSYSNTSQEEDIAAF
jgi:hypothetical protein